MGAILTSGASPATIDQEALAGPGGGEAPVVAPPSSFAPVKLGYVPALDGLRGAGLLTVFAFHAGFPIASGGPLSVSMFFTLSGFLIASLALREHWEHGRLSLRGFWERRARRLLPAALVTLAVIVVLQWAAEIGSAPAFRGDLLSTLGYATNWRLAARGGDYAQLFAAPSPLTHFWSLAIEEQFYLLFPVLFVGAMALFKRRPLRAGWAFAAVAGASFAVAAWSAGRFGNSGLTYYGTHTRAGEILFGVALAYAFANRRVRSALGSRLGGPVLRYGAVVALAGMAALWSLMTLASPSLFRGVTILNAALTGFVILAGTQAGGPIQLLLGNWPLRTIGKVSYAAYLIHWPLFLYVSEERFDMVGRPLFAVRVVLTLTLAAVSYWVVEYPFRRRLTGWRRPRLVAVGAAGVAAVAAFTVVTPVHAARDVSLDLSGPPPANWDGEDYMFGTRQENRVQPKAGVPSQAEVLLVGDSVAWSISPGFAGWNDDNPDRNVTLSTHISFGCPLSGPGEWIGPTGKTTTWPDCSTWLPDLPLAFERTQPDVVVIAMGLGDIGGHEVEGEWREFGDPVFDEWFEQHVGRVADVLASAGVPVVWLTYPYVRLADPEDPTADLSKMPINDPERIDSLNDVIRSEVEDRPGFRVGDLNGWVASWPGGQFRRDLRDGVHFTMGGSRDAADFVVPEALAAARGEPTPPPPPGPDPE